MRPFTRPVRLAALPGLVAVGLALATGGPASAAPGWSSPVQLSTPIPPTDYVAGPAIAVNAAGTQVAAWYDQDAAGTQLVHVRTSANGATWSAATTLGQGVEPAVALSATGRAVAVWVGVGSGGGLLASVWAPGGGWSAPATVAAGTVSNPLVAVDRSGNALAAWISSAGGLQRASLPAGGAWSAPQTLAPAAADFGLAVNAGGAALAAWSTPSGAIVADSGNVLGSWAAPDTVAAVAYRQKGVHVALDDGGQAALAWRTRTGVDATSRAPDGTWAAPTVLTASQASGSVDVAIDGTGNAAVVLVESPAGGTSQFPVYVSRRPAGGAWSAPALLSGPADDTGAPRVVADETGTFVVGWTDDNSLVLKAAVSPPGGAFGAPAPLGSNGLGGYDVAVAPGHAAMVWIQGGAAASTAGVT